MGKIAAAINVSDAIVFIPLLYICMRTYIHTYIQCQKFFLEVGGCGEEAREAISMHFDKLILLSHLRRSV